MSATVLIENSEINSAYNGLSSQYSGRKEDYFALLYLTKRFKIPVDEAARNVCFGGNECAVDSFYFDEAARNLHLFQFKCSDDHLLFKDSLERLTLVGVQRLFSGSSCLEETRPLLSRLRDCLVKNQSNVEKISVNLVFSGDPMKAEKSRLLDSMREYLESRKYIIDNFFGREVEMIFQVISSKRSVGHAFRRGQSQVYTTPCHNMPMKIATSENELIVTFLPLGFIYTMYEDMGDRFFEKNIRCGVGNGRTTKYEIKNSLRQILEGREEPGNFTFYHNGVTMTAQEVRIGTADSSLLSMVEPRILNGVQTVKTVRQFVKEHKRQREKVRKMLDGVRVMTRIVRSDKEDFLKKVTISNNRQNPIMPWNLRANDLIQLHLEDVFREKLGIYYERRENALEDLTDEDLEEMTINHRKAIKIRKLAQTLLALHGEIERISQMKQVFESQKWYSNTFSEKYLSTDPSRLVILYKVQYRLNAIVRQIQFFGNEKYDYLGKLRNLVWGLAIQGMLNDDQFSNHAQSFGHSLLIEANFNALLKRIATMKLRFILGNALGDKKYRDYISEGKLSFLKTKATFNECMAVAGRQFGWIKRDL